MKVTGYQLQQAIRELHHARDIVAAKFDDSLFVFTDENKPHPTKVMEEFLVCEAKIAKLQTIQQMYNLRVRVQLLGNEMTLSEAVKRVGGAGRAEKMWRLHAKESNVKKEYYGRRTVRNKDEEYPIRQISVEDTHERARDAARFSSRLRSAIQVANTTELEFEDLPEELFER